MPRLLTILKNCLLIICLFLSLSACGDKSSNKNIERYDFFDEANQDFFSKFMREVDRRYLDSLDEKSRREFEQQDLARKGSEAGYRGNKKSFWQPFDNQRLKEALGIEPEKPINFLLIINRITPEDHREYYENNHINGRDELLARYKELAKENKYPNLYDYEAKPCPDSRQIQDLFCLKDTMQGFTHSVEYFYFPKESQKKIPYIDQRISFKCELLPDGDKSCRMRRVTDFPYNMEFFIDFRNPDDFFDIISYTEQYVYNITGEHIWQNSLKQN